MITEDQRKQIFSLQEKAAQLIRSALPEAVTNVYDDMQTLDTLYSMADRLTPRGSECLTVQIIKLGMSIERASSAVSGEAKELLTVAEAARVAKVSKATIYRMVYAGDLPAVRLGRLVRIARPDLEYMINQHRE